jgi:hypothetical protein
MPVFLPLATLISNLVGYQLPVVCSPLSQGATITPTITISVAGQQVSGSTSATLPNDALGVTAVFWFPAGATVTVALNGQTVTLPTIPADTTETHEATPPPLPAGLTPVAVPGLIVLDQTGVCDGWTSSDPAQRGIALLAAVHEAMHAHYAERNEALTECRAMQTLPTVLQTLFPALASPAPPPPGAEPAKPTAPRRTSAWRRAHAAAWKLLLARWRHATARWQLAHASWQAAQLAYDQWLTTKTAASAMTAAAQRYDAELPAQYHGASC